MNLFLVKLYNLLNPLSVFAQHDGSNSTTSTGGVVENIQIEFTNPLGGNGTNPLGIDSLTELLSALLKIIITVGIPLVVLAIIYTGFLFVSAMGDKAKIEEARRAFLWTVVGAIIILSSWVIAEAIEGTITQIINS